LGSNNNIEIIVRIDKLPVIFRGFSSDDRCIFEVAERHKENSVKYQGIDLCDD